MYYCADSIEWPRRATIRLEPGSSQPVEIAIVKERRP